MYSTIDEAVQALQEIEQTVAEDQGEEMVDAAWGDIVRSVAEQCDPGVATELLRRNGL